MTQTTRGGSTRLLAVAIAWATAWTGATAYAAEPPPMRVHFIDVGQGDATLFEFPCAAVLVDTGGEDDPGFHSDDALIAYLDSFFAGRPDLDRTFALVALTHPHVDHTRGVEVLLRKGFRIKSAVWNGQPGSEKGRGQKMLRDHVQLQNIPYREIVYPNVAAIDLRTDSVIDPVDCPDETDPTKNIDPRIRILWGQIRADPGWGFEMYKGEKRYHFADENNHSLVIRVDYGDASVLLTGDLEEVAQRDLLARYGSSSNGSLDIDVYQVGHHGSANGTTEGLLRAMTPKVSVISMGPASRVCKWWWRGGCFTAHQHGHPRKTTVARLERHTSLRRSTPRTEQVASGQRTFEPHDVERCIYGTGWSGTVVLSARPNGWIEVIEPASQPCG